jgi:hypothetical protein
MQGQFYSSTLKNGTTNTTTPPSGPNTDAYSRLPEKVFTDPYKPVTDELHSLLTRKRTYYGCPLEHPLANAQSVADQGIEPWVYQLARIGEKVRRCGGLRGTLELQAIRKTLMDIAGHATVAIALLDQEKKSEH